MGMGLLSCFKQAGASTRVAPASSAAGPDAIAAAAAKQPVKAAPSKKELETLRKYDLPNLTSDLEELVKVKPTKESTKKAM